MDQSDFDKLKLGDQIRGKLSGNVYTITNDITEGNRNRSYIAGRTVWAESPSDWELVAKIVPVEQTD